MDKKCGFFTIGQFLSVSFFYSADFIIIKSLSFFFSFTGGEQLQNIDSFPLLNRKRRNQEMAFYRPTKKHNSLFFINSSNKGKTEKFQETKSDQGKEEYKHHQSTVGYFTLSILPPRYFNLHVCPSFCILQDVLSLIFFSNYLIALLLLKEKIF